MAMQGVASFSGLDVRKVLSCTFTFGQGISPSTCSMTIAPESSRIAYDGVLTFAYGPTRITFQDARIDRIDRFIGTDGHEVWQVSILDRRWKWKDRCGVLSGFYNVRRDESYILPHTVKQPAELAKLCLDAAGERGYDVSALPKGVFPEVAWEYENPMEALARLCDSLGCRVSLSAVNNRVKVVKLGQGRGVSANGQTLEGDISFDPPEAPDAIVIVSARNRYQAELDLIPLGLDLDGKILPIDKLSYAPKVNGKVDWKYADVENFQNVPFASLKARGLAQQSVFRWYGFKTPIQLPGVKEKITDVTRILPLESTQIETDQREDKSREPRPPWVFGRFWDGSESYDTRLTKFGPPEDDNWQGLYTKGFVIDAEAGIVKFSEPVFLAKTVATETGLLVYPPELKLRIACGLRDKDTRAWLRTEFRRKAGGKPAKGEKFVKYEDVVREIYYKSTPPKGVRDNLKDCQKTANYYLAAEEAKYQTGLAGGLVQAGFVPVDLDGVVQQVTWTVTGEGRATTKISVNREDTLVVPSYAERRLFESLGDYLDSINRPERAKRDDERRKKGR